MTSTYRSDLPERPERMLALPLDERGYPVPWFVAKVDGKWDFRCVRPGGISIAVRKRLCWLCGQERGRYAAFVVGPMCGVNRISSEPPSHRDCAEYAVKACPFLTRPLATRNERDMPEGASVPAGTMIKRNPGCTLIWISKQFTVLPIYKNRNATGVLFSMGIPTEVQFWAKGRMATREEVEESVRTGLPLLEREAERDGAAGTKTLLRCKEQFDRIVEETFA